MTRRDELLDAAGALAQADATAAARARDVLELMPRGAPAVGYWVVSHLGTLLAADPARARADAEALACVAAPASAHDVLEYARTASKLATELSSVADTADRERARLAWLDRCTAVPLEPPDFILGGHTELEMAALVAVVRGLDEAVLMGLFAPLDADPAARLSVIDEVLDAHSDEGSVRERIRRARMAAWSARPGAQRGELVEAIRGKLAVPVTPGEDERAMVEPLRWLLDRSREGLTVDRRRAPQRGVLRELAGRTGWPASRVRAPQRTAAGRARALLELGLVLRLLHRRDAHTVVTSPLGVHAADHPGVLWQRLARSLVVCAGPVFGPLLEADLLLFLREPRPSLADHMTARARLLAETQWAGNTLPGGPGRVAALYQRWVEPLAAALGLFVMERKKSIALPPSAERTALGILRGYATSPSRTIPAAA